MGVFFLSNLAKYIPGKVFMAVGRTAELTRLGIPPSKGTMMLLVELGVFLLGAGLIAAVSTSINIGSGLGLAACGLGLLCLYALTRSRTTQRIAGVVNRFSRGFSELIDLEHLRLAECLSISVIAWTLYGLAGWFVARSMTDVEIGNLPVFLAVLPLSWAAGLLAVIAPGGIGVREAAVVVGLAPLLSTPVAVAVAAVLRLTWFVVEFAGWAVAIATRAKWSRSAGAGDGI